MATVITVPGAFNSYNTGNFGGALFSSPNTVIDKPPGNDWRNWSISNSSSVDDVNDLDAMIKNAIVGLAVGQYVIVAGHSRGGQQIYRWLRDKAPTTTVLPSQVLFISSGNPERKYGGKAYLRPDTSPAAYPGPSVGGPGVGYGVPDNMRGFRLLDIARQYDEWNDYPNNWENQPSLDAIGAGNIHSSYSIAKPLGANGYPTNWNDWIYWDEGTITYMISPTVPSPVLVPAPDPENFRAQIFKGKYSQTRARFYAYKEAVARQPIEDGYFRIKPVQSV